MTKNITQESTPFPPSHSCCRSDPHSAPPRPQLWPARVLGQGQLGEGTAGPIAREGRGRSSALRSSPSHPTFTQESPKEALGTGAKGGTRPPTICRLEGTSLAKTYDGGGRTKNVKGMKQTLGLGRLGKAPGGTGIKCGPCGTSKS